MVKDIVFADKDGESTSPEPQIPNEERSLRTQAYDKSVNDLVAMIGTGDLVLDPDYQRNYIWDNKRASLLIESILLNVPIPVIYVAEDDDSKWVVVDGLQRLTTLKRFFANEFKLSGFEVLSELNKEQFSTLNPKAQRILKNGILRIIVILKESNSEIKYDIFHRLNSGAVKLNEQEMRNCLYRGSLNTFVKEVRNNPLFLKMLGLKHPHPRFVDAELVLRYIALFETYNKETGKVDSYPNKMKTFLNRFLKANRAASVEKIAEWEKAFVTNIKKVHLAFGDTAFRGLSSDGEISSRVNRALIDILLLCFNSYSNEQITTHKASLVTALRLLPTEDTVFNDAILYATSDTKKLEYRITTWAQKISQIIA